MSIRRETQAEWAFKSRIYVGQIDSVDEEKGTADVIVGGTHDKIKTTIPLAGLSISGPLSSWMRYMPSPGDFVQVGYGPRNELEILGYTAFGVNTSDDSTSYTGNTAQRVRSEGYASIAREASSDANGLAIFRKLRSGEFDARSTGGAGFWASREGTLVLEAGETTMTFNKANVDVRARSDMFAFGGDGTEVRFGDVKRKLLPTDFEESKVTPNLASALAPKELRVTVGYAVPPLGVETSFASVAMGDVRDGFGLPVLNTNTGLPDRVKAQFFDPAGALALTTVEVDVAGNMRIAPTTFTIATDLPASIKFGSFVALEPFVKGLTWTTARALMHSVQAATWGSMAGLNGAQVALFAAQGGAAAALSTTLLAGPPTAPQSVEALNALLGAYFAQLGTFLIAQGPAYYGPMGIADAAQATAIGTFEAGAPSYLSIKILGE